MTLLPERILNKEPFLQLFLLKQQIILQLNYLKCVLNTLQTSYHNHHDALYKKKLTFNFLKSWKDL